MSVFTYVNAHWKTPLEIHFTYTRATRKFTTLLKHTAKTTVLFSTKCHLLHNCIFLCLCSTHIFHKPCTKIQIPTPVE